MSPEEREVPLSDIPQLPRPFDIGIEVRVAIGDYANNRKHDVRFLMHEGYLDRPEAAELMFLAELDRYGRLLWETYRKDAGR